jgi:hypothetical protein
MSLLVSLLLGFPALARGPRLKYLGSFSIPTGSVFHGTEIGGLSAVTFDPISGEFFAVSDEKVNPRIYRFKPTLSASSFQVEATGMIPLTDPKGAPFPPGYLDCEGITLNRGKGFYISSEGRSYLGSRIPSTIREFNTSGNLVGTFRTPPLFIPEPVGHRTHGARNNLGFESLSLLASNTSNSADSESLLFTAVESALIQDDTRADFNKGSLTRILRIRLRRAAHTVSQQFAYWVDPMTLPPHLTQKAKGKSATEPSVGLSDLLAFGENHFITLERGFARVNGEPITRIRLYWVSIQRATDVSSFFSLRGGNPFSTAQKTLLLDWNGRPGMDNFEGLSFGPLVDGKRTLILTADNNFATAQKTAWVAFQLEED